MENALVLDSLRGLWPKSEDGADELLVVLDEGLKFEETIEFAYEETEDMESIVARVLRESKSCQCWESRPKSQFLVACTKQELLGLPMWAR